jgi:uncharacterized protein YbaP (TraB family)
MPFLRFIHTLNIPVMKKLILLLIVFLPLFAIAQVETTKKVKKKRSNQKNNIEANSLLWKIEGKKIKEPSYLFGTIHMIPEEDFFWPVNTEDVIANCKRLTLEIDMANIEDNMAAQMSMMMNIFMKDGVTLPKLLSEEDYLIVKNHFENGNLPIPQMMLDKIKPMFLSMMVSEEFDFLGGGMLGGTEEQETDETGSGIKSYEMEFMKIAEENQMSTSGLESVEYQMSIFDSIPYKAQAKMLIDAVNAEQDTTNNMSNQMDEMISTYKAQDIKALYSLLGQDEFGLEEYEDVLLIQRNKNWIPIMKAQITEMPTFFAVGAGHLGGPQGVLALLRAEGFHLTPLSISNSK